MISYSFPSLYAGIYSLDLILDMTHRYYPEMRRWVLKEEDIDGTRVLEDKQTKQYVEIPKYNFALFPSGNPSVVPYDVISVIAPPTPRLVVPEFKSLQGLQEFAARSEVLTAKNLGAKITLGGVDNDELYLVHSVEYLPHRQGKRTELINIDNSKKSAVKLNTGDTLFAYMYPLELEPSTNYKPVGDVDYMPTSRSKELTDQLLVDSVVPSRPIHKQDWRQIWPRVKKT